MSPPMSLPVTPIYFDDLAVGQAFRSGEATMERDRLVAFAEEFDPQPQHLSEALAATSQFGTLVASGWHTASLSMRNQVDAFFARIPGGGMGARIELVFKHPVHPGDRLATTIEVLALRPSTSRPDRGTATLRTTSRNQHGINVLEMTAAVILPRRPPTA